MGILLKDFNVVRRENSLMIDRRRMALLRYQTYLIIGVLTFAIIFSWVFNMNINGLENKTSQFVIILLTTLLICFIIFFRSFTGKGFMISKNGSDFILDKKHVLNKDVIVGLYLDIYSSSDTLDRSVTIKLKTKDNAITLLRGLNEEESEAIAGLVLSFLELPESAVKKVDW